MAEYNSIHTGQEVDQAITNIGTHLVDTSNPHGVTKAQVGLENVDNTSDANKPISTATQTALDAKQATLVSGTNIRTLNNMSVLGSGNLDIGSGIYVGDTAPTGDEEFWLDTSEGGFTPEEVDSKISAHNLNTNAHADIRTALEGKQATISDLETIRSGASLGATAYQKPQAGIPKTDLVSGVQASLDLADTALQESDVPQWALQPTKPTYTKDEVGLGNVENKSGATIRSEMTSAEVTMALGFTPENISNKSNSYTDSSETTYASTKALVDGLATKENTISDLSAIRSGATAGSTAIQPNDNVSRLNNDAGYITSASISDKEDKTNKVNTITGNESDTTKYPSTKAIADYHDSTKQDTISDLADIRSGATLGSTAVQPNAISDMATKTWVGSQGYLTEHQSLADYSTTTQMNAAISAHHDSTKLDASLKGANNGVAELGSDGKVPTSQLPSYVDDVVEGYFYNNKFYEDSAHTIEITPESGKIYIDLHTNKTYRWGGSTYVEISASLALGETETTAYRGDRGKIAYDHSQLTSGNPHNVTFAQLSDRPTNVSAFTNDAGYLTEHQSLADYSTTAQMNMAIANHHDSTKQDTISDLTTIRSGATAGATALQPNDNVSSLTNDAGYITSASISDKEDKSNKVNTITGNESDTTKYPSTKAIADYHDSTKQNIIDASHLLSADLVADGTTNKVVTASEKSTWSGKQDAISDLSTIRSGASAGATAVQPAAISDMATQTWTTTQIQNSLILIDTVTSKRYRFVITNGVLGISEVE